MIDGSFLGIFGIVVALLLIAAVYCILFTKNLIRVLIGIELLTKAVTLLLVVAGFISGRMDLVQALIITLIVVEVVVIVVASGVVVSTFQHTQSLNTDQLKALKG